MEYEQPGPAGSRPEPPGAERAGSWAALMIALAPIPIALAISLALGSPPWRARNPAPAPVHPAGHR